MSAPKRYNIKLAVSALIASLAASQPVPLKETSYPSLYTSNFLGSSYR